MLVHKNQTELKQSTENTSKDCKKSKKRRKIKRLTNEEAKQETMVDTVPSMM